MSTFLTMIDKLKRSGVLVSPSIIKAFEHIDRADFVTTEYKNFAYDDRPLPIGLGQTISQPTTVVFMLERLQVVEDEKVLDVGSGSGWTTALMAHLASPSGAVFGVERIPSLVKLGQVNLGKYGYEFARILPAGKVLGLPDEAPFDKILVSAAAQEVPQELVEQLKIGGVMVLPVKSSLYKVVKTGDSGFKHEEFYGFSFVPLVQDPMSGEENKEDANFLGV